MSVPSHLFGDVKEPLRTTCALTAYNGRHGDNVVKKVWLVECDLETRCNCSNHNIQTRSNVSDSLIHQFNSRTLN